MKFTDAGIRNLKGTDKKRYVRDVRQGFTLRIMPSGVKTFLYIYTDNSKRKELNLGNYPEVTLGTALEKYQEAHNKFSNGIDPKYKEPVKELTTFNHFAELYLAWSEKEHSKNTYAVNKYSLNNDVLPFWKDRHLIDIHKRDAIELLERVASRSRGQVNNVCRSARGVFKYAIDRGYIEYNPMLGLTKVVPALKYNPRTRYLSDTELKTIWLELPAQLKLVLVTAQRPGEVAGMHREEIQIGVAGQQFCLKCRRCGVWTIPEERTKSGKVHLVYLTALALELIGHSDKYIFPSPKPGKPIERMALSRYVHRNEYFNLPQWGPHDLRRTARTIMERIGIPEAHSEAILAHGKQGMKKVYNQHEYQEEKKAALIKWEAELMRIVG